MKYPVGTYHRKTKRSVTHIEDSRRYRILLAKINVCLGRRGSHGALRRSYTWRGFATLFHEKNRSVGVVHFRARFEKVRFSMPCQNHLPRSAKARVRGVEHDLLRPAATWVVVAGEHVQGATAAQYFQGATAAEHFQGATAASVLFVFVHTFLHVFKSTV